MNTITKKLSQPFSQAAFTFGGIVIIMIFAKLAGATPKFYWKTSASLLFFYVILNTVFSIFSKEGMKYWRDSIYSFLGLAVLGGLCAYWASSLSIYKAGSYYSIYMVITIGYLVFSSIANALKKIGNYADNEEWEPKRPKTTKDD